MKKLLFSIVLLVLSHQSLATKSTLVIVSPDMNAQQAKTVYKNIRGAFFSLSPSNHLMVINGMTGNTIMHIALPDDEAYQDSKAKNNVEPFKWQALKRFLKSIPAHFKDKKAQSGGLDIPRLMAQVGRYQNLSDLIIVGSPLYHVISNPNMSMRSGLVPSDQYLINNARNNVFRTHDFKTRLKNVRVHWLLFEALTRQVHSDAVQRFWHHYLARQGASLVSYGINSDLMLKLYKDSTPALRLPDRLETNAPLEMQAIDDISANINLYDAPISQTPLTQAALAHKQAVTVGISWQHSPSIDLDIHAAPFQAERIYFYNQTSAQGQFYKGKFKNTADITRHETIVFHAPVSPNSLQLAVNAYSVNGTIDTPIFGEVRIKLQDQVYAQSFYFNVNKGNLGADTENAIITGIATPYTKLFRIADIIAQQTEVAL